jgi:serine/threonine protein kinase
MYGCFNDANLDSLYLLPCTCNNRHRHPNVVLIMGVAFVPIEVQQLELPAALQDDAPAVSRRSSIASSKAQRTLAIITEHLSQGSLEDIIASGALSSASYSKLLSIALQAARGMLYLHTHSPPICHRDLKSSNLVVDAQWRVKVCMQALYHSISHTHIYYIMLFQACVDRDPKIVKATTEL